MKLGEAIWKRFAKEHDVWLHKTTFAIKKPLSAILALVKCPVQLAIPRCRPLVSASYRYRYVRYLNRFFKKPEASQSSSLCVALFVLPVSCSLVESTPLWAQAKN